MTAAQKKKDARRVRAWLIRTLDELFELYPEQEVAHHLWCIFHCKLGNLKTPPKDKIQDVPNDYLLKRAETYRAILDNNVAEDKIDTDNGEQNA